MKKLRKKLQSENYQIPNVLPKIKQEALNQASVQNEQVKQTRNSPLKLLALSIISVLLVFSFVVIITNYEKIPTSESFKTYAVKNVKNEKDLANIIKLSNASSKRNTNNASLFNCASKSLDLELPTNDNASVDNSAIDKRGLQELAIDKTEVQEPDIIKYDDEYIYYLSYNKIYIYSYSVDETKLYTIKEEESENYISSMLQLHKQYLIFYTTVKDQEGFHVRVSIYDKTKNFQKVKEYQIEGIIQDTRLINDKFYLITQKTLLYVDKIIEPKVVIDKEKKTIDYEDVMYVNNAANSGYTYISTISLNDKIELSQTVQLGPNQWDAIYSSPTHLFLASSKNDLTTTYIYKYETSSMSFIGVVQNEGTVINKYAIDHFENQVRIVYTSRIVGNSLHIYDINKINQDKKLSKIGYLDEGIGPNQTVRAVRFDKTTVYVVTYQNTDPLYEINISDPTNPLIANRVEGPGFSSYLVDMGNDYLIGIGYDDNFTCKISLYKTSEQENIANTQIGIDLQLVYYNIFDNYDFTSINQLMIDQENKIIGIPFISVYVFFKINQEAVNAYFAFANEMNLIPGEKYLNTETLDVYEKTIGGWQYVQKLKTLPENTTNYKLGTYDLSKSVVEIATEEYFARRALNLLDKYFVFATNGNIKIYNQAFEQVDEVIVK